jgi:hypothetical protein
LLQWDLFFINKIIGVEKVGINIKYLDKAKLLLGLFNNSKPQGLGFFASGSNKAMTYPEAQKIVAKRNLDFDYLQGRVMKVDISGDELDPRGYDSDNGLGSALSVVTTLRNSVEVTFNKAAPTMEELAAQRKKLEAMDAEPIRDRSFK